MTFVFDILAIIDIIISALLSIKCVFKCFVEHYILKYKHILV